MSVTAIDTHEVVKELKAAGFTDDQAEAVTRVVRSAQDIDLSNLATKTDLAALRTDTKADLAALRSDMAAQRSDTKADFAQLRSDTKTDLAEVKADLLKWMVSAIGFQTVVILGAVFALAHVVKS